MREPHFSHLDTNSQKLKVDQNFLVGPSQKWVWPIWFWDSKIVGLSQE